MTSIKASSQRGVVLLVALIMLLLLTLLALSSMRSSTLQNRLGGSVSEQKRAYNAADSALREGERRVNALKLTATFSAASAGYSSCASSVAAIGSNLCLLVEGSDLDTTEKTQAWAKTALAATGTASTSVAYTGYDGKSAFTSLPRWVATVIASSGAEDVSLATQGKGTYYYRVTAAATAGGARFPVILQSVIKVEVQ